MVRKRFAFVAALVALLVLLWATGGVVASPPAEGPRGEVNIAGTVASKISYQGRLTDSAGNPLDGTYTMRFVLHDSEEITLWDSGDMSVPVANGLFNVELDVDPGDFNGQELWLVVFVDGEALLPRQQILPVPYALSLRPGAVISDTTSYVELNRFRKISQPFVASWKYGVYAKSEGTGFLTSYYGVYGSGSTAGVFGSSDSGTGVYGKAASSDGYGGYFYNTASGGVGLYTRAKDDWDADLVLGGTSDTHDNGCITSDPAYSSSDIVLVSNDNVRIDLDNDGTGEDADFEIYDKDNNRIFDVDESGEVYADGSFHSGGADFAEMFPAVKGLEPGDVLVIGPDGKLARSNKPYATNVVGVYSTNPGFVGGDGDDDDPTGKVPLAVLGIVPVKASAENGPIKPGDLLTSASMPGYAMKATDLKIGTIIGKALEGLDEGTGVIKMLVMLQ